MISGRSGNFEPATDTNGDVSRHPNSKHTKMEEWVFDSILEFLGGPYWLFHVGNFIDDNCAVFDTEEENKLNHTTVHEVIHR